MSSFHASIHTLFPYTTLFRSDTVQYLNYIQQQEKEVKGALTNKIKNADQVRQMMLLKSKEKTNLPLAYSTVDRKSTRLNSSHVAISYAVFCLKKQKQHKTRNF